MLALSAVCIGSISIADYDNNTNCNECLKTLRKLRIPPEEMFVECKFKDQMLNCGSFLKEIWLKSGLCYTFNGAEVYRNNNLINELDAWTIDEGYAPTAGLDVYPYRATGVGEKSGLTFLLRYRKAALEYLCDKRPGFWVKQEFVKSTENHLKPHCRSNIECNMKCHDLQPGIS
jgi:Amiloride-sensitive sodium channel